MLCSFLAGECLYGKLKGSRLTPTDNLLNRTVRDALADWPDIRVVMSERPVRVTDQHKKWNPAVAGIPVLGPWFLLRR